MREPAPDGRPAWPAVPDYLPDLFTGTAWYYARYRVPYPQELIDDLRMRAELTGEGRLLDLACGTGEVALSMHTFFREVWAVDQEQEMVEVGRRKAEQCRATNVLWMVGRAEEVEAPPTSFELITIGSAFHRLDRRLIAECALRWLPPGRCIVELGSNAAWKGKEEWQHVAAEVIAKWIDKPSSARRRTHRPYQCHEEILEAVGFEDVENHRFPTPYVWTLDSFVGYLCSTSKASKAVLGDHAEEFEADLRRALLDYDSRGQYPETIDFYYILGRRPSPEAPRA